MDDVIKDVDSTPSGTTLDSRGRLKASRRPVKGWRRIAEVARNALIFGCVSGAVVGATFHSALIGGIVLWIVFVVVLAEQLRPSSRGCDQQCPPQRRLATGSLRWKQRSSVFSSGSSVCLGRRHSYLKTRRTLAREHDVYPSMARLPGC
jgi:hypothetical protein